MKTPAPTVVIVPGLRDHVPEHWQTHLEHRLPNAVSVPRMATDAPQKLSLAAWVHALDATLARVSGSVVLVAHSAGCAIVAHWAQKHRRPIDAALLATPPDFVTPLPAAYPPLETFERNGWMPLPRVPLPFPSIVAASTNDPLSDFDRVVALARDWGSRVVDLGGVGHLNPASGFGAWPLAETLVDELCG